VISRLNSFRPERRVRNWWQIRLFGDPQDKSSSKLKIRFNKLIGEARK
jgi:hypothetical protein